MPETNLKFSHCCYSLFEERVKEGEFKLNSSDEERVLLTRP